ncbi:MAG: NAD-dependent succinate-semialdehyde dehydrogenase [Sphingorhabdus sp.]
MSGYETLDMLIDGEWINERDSGEDVINPATGQALARLPHATTADLDRALAASARAFPGWAATSANDRAKILRAGVMLLRERQDSIARTLTLEQGKPLAESLGEVAYAIDCIEWYAEEGRRAYGRIVPSRNPGVRQFVTKEPVGPAIAFTPWNFPALTPARKIGGALAAGCTLVLKAAEETPGTAIAIARALVDAGVPPGVLNLVFGDPATVSAHLIASPLSRKLSFTGSTAVGRQLQHLALDHGMMRTTMELGGHGPVLVFDDVEVDATADLLAAAKFRNAGQVCISPTRFFVQQKAYDRFVERFVMRSKALVLGDGLDPATNMGPLANPRRIDAMERLVADAEARGGTVLTGGKRVGNQGWFYEPTVITGIGDDALVMTEEPFGPVVPIVPFTDFDEVITRANALPYGLAAYAFAQDRTTAAKLGSALAAGMVGVNTLAVSTPETPFGGVKESGHGSESGIEGLDAYLDTKFIAEG